MKLYKYLANNKEGLLPYDKRGIEISAPPKGMVYKGLGVQENQNCTVITLRMKHRRMRWSKSEQITWQRHCIEGKKQGIDRNYRQIYRRTGIHVMQMQEIIETIKCSKGSEKRRKGKQIH